MGTTFVTITRSADGGREPGFWMRDSLLELWLRLLALHLPEPNDYGEHRATPAIRNRWLLASKGYFVGCVPHDMEEACETTEGRAVVRAAIESLLAELGRNDSPLEAETLNLLGFASGRFVESIDRKWLAEIGQAFLDLLDGKIDGDARSTAVMPGSKPYKRRS